MHSPLRILLKQTKIKQRKDFFKADQSVLTQQVLQRPFRLEDHDFSL